VLVLVVRGEVVENGEGHVFEILGTLDGSCAYSYFTTDQCGEGCDGL